MTLACQLFVDQVKHELRQKNYLRVLENLILVETYWFT